VVVFATAGTIEGFVTGSALPTSVRVGIGVLVETGFLLYFLSGRKAPTPAGGATAGPSP
jgi:hypothetical protein